MTNEQVDRDNDHEDASDFVAMQKHSKGKGSGHWRHQDTP
jgi:hypothetical protein